MLALSSEESLGPGGARRARGPVVRVAQNNGLWVTSLLGSSRQAICARDVDSTGSRGGNQVPYASGESNAAECRGNSLYRHDDEVIGRHSHFSTAREISKSGTKNLPLGMECITGYTIIHAESLDEAEKVAQDNPYIASIRVYEIMTPKGC